MNAMRENGEEIQFDGVSLNDTQRADLKEHLREVLGESYYALAYNFFESVWNSSARYKVFFARRCLNLMYAFYRANYAKLDPKLSSTLYSDSSLLLNVPDIADGYLLWHSFPKIIVVDDMLLHGRTINNLIDNLVNSIYDYIVANGCHDEKSEIETSLLNSLTIQIMVRTNKPLLLRDKYYRCLKAESDEDDAWFPRQWREFSLRISQFILENKFYNTSYILSLHEPQNANYKDILEEAALRNNFKKFEYYGRFRKTIWVKPLTRSNGQVVAFYTIRIMRNRVDRNYCIVPFVIMADLAYDTSKEMLSNNKMTQLLLGDFINCSGYERTKAETLYMLLSHNLLLLLMENTKMSSDLFDVDKISITFRSNNDNTINTLPKRIAELKEPVMSWEEMENFILNTTKNSSPLFENSSVGTRSADYLKVLEDTIAEEGRIMEKDAFLEYSKGIHSPNTGKQPITELFSKLSEQLDINKINLSELLSKLLELMDMGSTAVSSRRGDVSGREFIICSYRPGEQSLFILPKRYMQDFPVLLEMEKDCLSDNNIIRERIDVLYHDIGEPEHAEALKEFVYNLYDSGQRLIDWDINMLMWSEMPIGNGAENSDQENDNQFVIQMIFNITKQSELMKHYRKLYPNKQ